MIRRMKAPKRVRLLVLATVLSAAITLIGGLELRGKTVRTVHILTLFFGGVASGASLAQTMAAVRARRAERTGATPAA